MRVKAITLAFISVLFLTMWISPVTGEEKEELNPVLLVIDVQNIWMPMMAEEDVETAPQKINEQILRDGGHNAVFLCGLSATGCVLATYYGATDRRLPAIMVKNALLSHDAEYTKVIEDICYSMTIEEVKETLDESAEH